MALRIACDLDGTLADMESALQREAERLFGSEVDLRASGPVTAAADADVAEEESRQSEPARPESDRRPLSRAELRTLWRHVRQIENFWTTLAEIEPGSVARLAALAALHGWEVIFLTQRPPSAGATAQVQTQRWLQARGFALPSVFVLDGSRGKVADALALHAVIDDRPENALDVATDSKARSILVWRDTPETVPAVAARLGIHVVLSFAAAVGALEQMMTPPTTSQRLLKRVREVIGL
jgi:hypothetical protein